MHGLSREVFASAPLPAEVVAQLNQRMVGTGEAHCDEPTYDRYWLDELMASAGQSPTFELVDVRQLYGESKRDSYLTALSDSQAPHRAEGDALRIAEAALKAIND